MNEKNKREDIEFTESGKRNKKPYRKKGKSNRNTRNSSRNNRDSVEPKRNSTANDPKWYNRFTALANGAGDISFLNKAGNPLRFRGNAFHSVPGVCVLNYVPSVGTNTFDASDASTIANHYAPVNIAARNLYKIVNYKNSRNWTYDAPDLMQYVIAMGSAYALYQWACRVYGLLNMYSMTNLYMPYGILKGMNVAHSTFKNKLANFKWYINRFAADLAEMAIPKGFPFFERYKWCNSNVFMDSQVTKSQFYVFNQEAFYKYYPNATIVSPNDPTSKITAKGGVCALTTIPVAASDDGLGMITYDTLIKYMEDLSHSITSSQDLNNMSTDILKACEGNLFSWELVPDGYTVPVSVAPEALLQIHNSRFLGTPIIPVHSYNKQTGFHEFNTVDGCIYHTAAVDNLVSNIKLKSVSDLSKYLAPINPDEPILLDTFEQSPSTDSLLEMTRCMCTFTQDQTNGEWNGKYRVLHCGTEVFTTMNIVYNDSANAEKVLTAVSDVDIPNQASSIWALSSGTVEKAMEYAYAISKFDWSPMITINVITYDDQKNTTINSYNLSDLTNYTTIRSEDLNRLHTTALMSEFAFYAVEDKVK